MVGRGTGPETGDSDGSRAPGTRPEGGMTGKGGSEPVGPAGGRRADRPPPPTSRSQALSPSANSSASKSLVSLGSRCRIPNRPFSKSVFGLSETRFGDDCIKRRTVARSRARSRGRSAQRPVSVVRRRTRRHHPCRRRGPLRRTPPVRARTRVGCLAPRVGDRVPAPRRCRSEGSSRPRSTRKRGNPPRFRQICSASLLLLGARLIGVAAPARVRIDPRPPRR
jgi:hypothetical protein